MRTTLEIEDDVLEAAKEMARRQRLSTGRVISELVRRALTTALPTEIEPVARRHGFRPFASRGALVTNETINRLREQEGV